MRTGISTASLFMRQYNEDAVQTINRLGVKTCEIFWKLFRNNIPRLRRTVKRKKGESFRQFPSTFSQRISNRSCFPKTKERGKTRFIFSAKR